MIFRTILIAAVVAAALLLGIGDLCAQEVGRWPEYKPWPTSWRGPGDYLSWTKIAACWLVFLAWAYSSDWVNRDLQENKKLSYLRWNPIVFGVFMAWLLFVWVVPLFWFDFIVLVIAWVAPLTTYIVYRNARVSADERVLTPAHIRYWLSQRLALVGVKMAAEKADPHETGPPVKLLARGGATERDDNVRLLTARQTPGMRAVRGLLAEGLTARASAIMLDYTPQGVAVNYMIDGVWLSREPQDRDSADPALETLKVLCGLNPEDRKRRQDGIFAAEHDSVRYQATLTCQGTQTGERAVVQFEQKKIPFTNLDELGMRTKLQEQVLELLHQKQGIVLFSAMPANGLRTSTNILLRATDRLTRDFMAVEDEGKRYEEIENIPVSTYKAADGETPASVLAKVLRMEPDVVVVRDLVDVETVCLLCDATIEERLAIGTVRAKDSAEALLRVLALGVPAAAFAKAALAVINQRLVRKLCDSCKEAYTPTAEVLKQLGIPAGRVESLYRPPQPNPDEPKEPCKACEGIGYVGRTAIFEVLPVGDTVRRVLAGTPKLDLVRSAARKDGMRSLQEEGILLVARGVTSLPELMRVLKQ